jgi:hypothetical protein
MAVPGPRVLTIDVQRTVLVEVRPQVALVRTIDLGAEGHSALLHSSRAQNTAPAGLPSEAPNAAP